MKREYQRRERVGFALRSSGPRPPLRATGIWLDGDDDFAHLLPRRFEASPHDVEVLDFAIDGRWRQLSILRQIEQEVPVYHPDLILAEMSVPFPPYVFYRDTYHGYVITTGRSEMPPEVVEQFSEELRRFIDGLETNPLGCLFNASFIFRAFARYYTRYRADLLAFKLEAYIDPHIDGPVGRDLIAPPPDVTESLNRIRDTIKRVEAFGSRTVPFQFERNREQQHLFGLRGFSSICLDIPDDPALRHKHDAHFNSLGHARVADQLYERLVPFLPGPFREADSPFLRR